MFLREKRLSILVNYLAIFMPYLLNTRWLVEMLLTVLSYVEYSGA